jgi:carboxymethylenebutenolidase
MKRREMFETEITVHTPDGEMTTFVAHPDDAAGLPVAAVLMDAVGYREAVKENARRFAADGYYCVAPDLFYRSGPKISFDHARIHEDDEYRKGMTEAYSKVTPGGVLSDLGAIFAAIADNPAANAKGPKVCVGYCMGARLVLHALAASPDEFVAGAGIHPGALVTDNPESPHHELADVRGELWFAFTEIDRSATAESVEAFRAEFERQGVKGAVERLPGLTHGYAMNDLSVYDRDAAEQHIERTLELWRRNLTPEPVGA